MFCLAPVVLIGSLFTVQTSWHHTTNMDGSLVEVQTCESGLGLQAKASSSGLVGIGVQYGLQKQWGSWSLTLQPSAGFSQTINPVKELPASTQFELGLGLLGGYQQWRVGIEYWHLSCGGLCEPNIGLDLLALKTGWVF